MAAKPLVVIVGPTASGKTSLAIKLATQFNGEIICADSRTVYRGLDIGTAKPTKAEQKAVTHWALDLVNPDQRFTAADFKLYALDKIEEIRLRGHVPFIVGGTGLYVDSVIFDYQFGLQSDKSLRTQLEKFSLDELYVYSKKNNIQLPENYKNKRYVIRAIEQKSINKKRRDIPIEDCIIVGITTNKDVLKDRISQRAEQLLHDGVVEEAKKVGKKYGWESEAMSGNIYPLCRQYLQGEISTQQLQEKFIVLDWRLAKRQMTWLKRNPYISWYPLDEAESYLKAKLASEH